MDGSWLQLKLKRRRLQRRLHAHLTLLNIRVTKQTNPEPNPNRANRQLFVVQQFLRHLLVDSPVNNTTVYTKLQSRMAGSWYAQMEICP